MTGEAVEGRAIWRLTGRDRLSFLQGVVSNDLRPLDQAPGIVWTALLTPQGKYLADFFVVRTDADTDLLLDLPEALAQPTLRRLQMYRLRADVTMAPAELTVCRGLGAAPPGALRDPRHDGLGWRSYGLPCPAGRQSDWAALRVDLMVPEYPDDLVPEDSYLLEMGFDRLNGVDFRKGCYVGQEVTARMKHKTELKKGLVRVRLEGSARPGTPITLEDGREAGRLGTVAGTRALAHLRFDRLAAALWAGEASVTAEPPPAG